MEDPYHGPKLVEQLESWAQDPCIRTNPPLTISTRAASRNIDGHADGDTEDDVECLHPHLRLSLIE